MDKEEFQWKLYRKRIIPDECIPLDNDKVLYADDRIIVTSWRTIRPKQTFDHGYSCYFMNENYKISRFLRSDGSLLYWYCDIVDLSRDEDSKALIFRDLLADVLVYPDGFVKVTDLDEFEQALESGAIDVLDVRKALRALSGLLNIIYDKQFDTLTEEIMLRI